MDKIKHKILNTADFCPAEKGRFRLVNVDIWIDNNMVYKTYGFKPCIFFRNGYLKECKKLFSLTISDNPKTPDDFELQISIADYQNLKLFVKLYKDVLLDIANGKEPSAYMAIINHKPTISEENERLLLEMPKLEKKISGLPMDIWVDDNETYKLGGHSKRIKFSDGRSTNTRDWPSLTIPDFNTVPRQDQIKVPAKNIDLLRSFCLINKKQINDVMVKKIPFEEFEREITKIDKSGKPIKTIRPFYKYKDAGYGYEIVVHQKTGLFSYTNPNGALITDKWFDSASEFKKLKDGTIRAFVYDEENLEFGLIDFNGNIYVYYK